MALMYNIGDQVRLKEGSQYYLNNDPTQLPISEVGTIIKIINYFGGYEHPFTFYYKVDWEDGRNEYRPIDLELIEQQVIEQFEDWED